MLQQFQEYVPLMKLKSLKNIMPSLVKEYHEDSYFDIRLFPTKNALLPSQEMTKAKILDNNSLQIDVPLEFDILLGD